MQIWLDFGQRSNGVDLVNGEDLIVDGDAVYIDGKIAGRRVDVSDSKGQARARSMAGSLEWILLDLGDWKMIPIENIIAACDGTPTKVAARISTSEQLLGAAFALQIGVDALLVPESILESALIAKSQRLERTETEVLSGKQHDFTLTTLEVPTVTEGGVGDRVCVDFTGLLSEGEGMLVGSSSSSMALVHGETVESEFVPTRPFRVNAGAAHSYTLMADGTTKYLSELKMGDEVKVISQDSAERFMTVGRVKIEKRPFILLKWKDENNNQSVLFLQQAETVRLVGISKELIPVTSINIGMKILGYIGGTGRHIGIPINAEVKER